MAAVETSAATCCWCAAPLKRIGDGPWLCWTEACNRRQHEWALAIREQDGPRGKVRMRWLYVPTPRQVEFHETCRRVPRVLYGGAAGPGKSHALRWGLYRDCLRVPNLNCLLLRRTFPELEKTHLRAMVREAALVGAEYLAGARVMRFPNGSLIETGHCEGDEDAARYLSAEYDRIAFDELVTFNEEPALEIMSRARSSKAEVVAAGGAQVWAGTNPGGRGARWVKSLFVDREVDREQYPNYDPSRYGYVEARLSDNPYIDPSYRQTLEEMRETRRRQLLYGDWDVFDGQFFDWKASCEGKPWHVRRLVETPADLVGLPLGGGLDWGSASPGCYGFYVGLPDGRVHKFDEYKFQRQTVAEVAEAVKAKWKAWGVTAIPPAGADPALKAKTGQIGESMQQTFARHGVPLVMVSNDRLNGWQRLHEALRTHPDGQGPFFSVDPERCKYTARTLPLQVQDSHNPEDLDTDGDDHAADETRYALQRLWSGRKLTAPRAVPLPVNSWGWWRRHHENAAKPSGVLA